MPRIKGSGSIPWNRVGPFMFDCRQCGARFEVPYGRRATVRYCSNSCRHAHQRTVTGTDHPLYTRIERTCEMCGTVVHVKAAHQKRFRFCSRRCSGAWVCSTWPRTSSIERALRKVLTIRGIPFEGEYPIGPFTVDLAFPAYRLVVEADGTYWHGTEKQQRKDRRKDGYLRGNYWNVLRLTEIEITSDIDACVDRIVVLLNLRTARSHPTPVGERTPIVLAGDPSVLQPH